MIRHEIIEKICRDDHVSFVEIERIFEKGGFNYRGDKVIHHNEYPHLIIWAGWNDAAVKIIEGILNREAICMQNTYYLIYLVDGGGLSIPVAKSIRNYKKDRWLPIVFRPEAKCQKSISKLN